MSFIFKKKDKRDAPDTPKTLSRPVSTTPRDEGRHLPNGSPGVGSMSPATGVISTSAYGGSTLHVPIAPAAPMASQPMHSTSSYTPAASPSFRPISSASSHASVPASGAATPSHYAHGSPSSYTHSVTSSSSSGGSSSSSSSGGSSSSSAGSGGRDPRDDAIYAASAGTAATTGVSAGSATAQAMTSSAVAEVLALREYFASIGVSVRSFVIGDTLGTGTFGRVMLVTCTHNKRVLYFALKSLKKSEIIRLKQVDHIKSEKAILERIAHPFIVSLYTSFVDERCLYMLMEFVIGGELFSQLRKAGRFVNDTARFYAAEIALAFAYLHENDIVYRDLKPENLLFDKEGHIKITDFGFAKVVPDRTWTLCGTPEYLAPEIKIGRAHV